MAQTIMLAVNDPNILYLLQRYAEESGFNTVRITPREDILALAQQSRPTLIILEIGFPDSVGRNALHALKTEPITRDIPVVVYSCLDEALGNYSENVAGSLKSGMYADFLTALEHAGVRPERLAQ